MSSDLNEANRVEDEDERPGRTSAHTRKPDGATERRAGEQNVGDLQTKVDKNTVLITIDRSTVQTDRIRAVAQRESHLGEGGLARLWEAAQNALVYAGVEHELPREGGKSKGGLMLIIEIEMSEGGTQTIMPMRGRWVKLYGREGNGVIEAKIPWGEVSGGTVGFAAKIDDLDPAETTKALEERVRTVVRNAVVSLRNTQAWLREARGKDLCYGVQDLHE